jgi:hypothetical protein
VLSAVKLAALLVVIPGCKPGTLLERASVAVAPPASWHSVLPTTWMVPGTPLAAWSGPDGSSFAIYRTLWVPAGSPEMLAEALGNRLANLPGLKLLVKRSEAIAGIQAARLEVIAPGTGDALAPSGLGQPIQPPGKTLTSTRQVTLAFIRPTETIYLTWHMPENSYDRIEPDIRTTLQSLRFDSRADSSYRK